MTTTDATTQPTVALERAGAVATIRIDRPRALNALDEATLRDLARAIRDVRRDGAVRAVLITGTGPKAFCAGADIAAMAAMSALDGQAYSVLGHEVFARLEALEVPVVAAVNGAALGGGLELALACDLVVASDQARLGLPETTLGLVPGFGGTQRLALRVGVARARELVYLGRVLDAAEALRVGLVDRVVAADALAAEAGALAAELAGRAPVALRQAKRLVGAAARAALAAALAHEVDAFAATFASEDRVEGLRAFLEKRPPAWKGR
jgi:enoyl-CoA hydratase